MVKMNVSTDDGSTTVSGVLLAQSGSKAHRHRQHNESRFAPMKQRCSACRWTRITILRDEDPQEDRPYVIISEGFSIVPGEKVLGKVERTSSPLWVIEYLHRRNKEREKYLPIVARNALMMAVQYDEKLARECEHRGLTL